MRFGEKLKSLRSQRDWTQPQMADAIGIEQSYLSKLENDKSLPSNEIFERILEVLETDVADYLQDLDQRARTQLRQLPVVAEFMRLEKREIIGNRRRWLVVSAALVALGAAAIYAGTSHLFFPNVVYQYKSDGVVRDGEPKEIFRNFRLVISDLTQQDERVAIEDALKARIDEDFRLHYEFRGNVYNEPTDGGSRTYYLHGDTETDPWQNKLIVFLGVLLGTFGLIGLLLDAKLSRRA